MSPHCKQSRQEKEKGLQKQNWFQHWCLLGLFAEGSPQSTTHTPVLKSLQWLPISRCIDCKMLALTPTACRKLHCLAAGGDQCTCTPGSIRCSMATLAFTGVDGDTYTHRKRPVAKWVTELSLYTALGKRFQTTSQMPAWCTHYNGAVAPS